MPKRVVELLHDALVAQIAHEPERFFYGDFMLGKKIYARAEPSSFGSARKRVDGFFIFQMQAAFVFEIVAFELKLGHKQINNGYAQLKTVVDFFADSGRWLEWAKEILKTVPGQWKVWLTTELLIGQETGEIESYNLFPDDLLPKRRFVGFYPQEPPKKVKLINYSEYYGVTVSNFLEAKKQRRVI